jgi:hypothetical protein
VIGRFEAYLERGEVLKAAGLGGLDVSKENVEIVRAMAKVVQHRDYESALECSRPSLSQIGRASIRLAAGPAVMAWSSNPPRPSRVRHSASVRSLPPSITSMMRSSTFA